MSFAPEVIATLGPCPHCGITEALITNDLGLAAIAGSADAGWVCEVHGYAEVGDLPCCHVHALLELPTGVTP